MSLRHFSETNKQKKTSETNNQKSKIQGSKTVHKGQQEVPQLTSTIGCTSVGTSTNSTISSTIAEASMKLVDSDKVWNSLVCIGLFVRPVSSTTAMAFGLRSKRPSKASVLILGSGLPHLIQRAKIVTKQTLKKP